MEEHGKQVARGHARLPALLAFACAVAVMPETGWAQIAPAPVAATPGFSVGVGLATQYDSNVARVPDDAGAGSWINEASGSLHFDQTYGRQHVYATADAGRVLYRQLPIYNYTHENLHAGWRMNLPDSINAEVDVTRTLELARFADLNSTRRDVISRNAAHGTVDFSVATLWRLVGGVEVARLRNSNGIDSPADLNTVEFNGGIRYQTGSENQIELLARTIHGTYPSAQATFFGNADYRNRGVDLRMKWKFSGASTLFGRIGYIDSRSEALAFRDFSGLSYDLTYLWQPTARTSVTFYFLRDIGATGDNQYLQSVTHIYRLTPSYAITSKITADAMIEYRRYDYANNAQLIVVGLPPAISRADDVLGARIGLAWAPRRWLTARLGQTWEQRTTTAPGFEYLDRTSSLALQATF